MRQIAGYPLWLGHVGDVRDLRRVLDAEIAAIVDLAASEPPAAITRDVVYCRFPLVDGPGNAAWMLRGAIGTLASLLRCDIRTLVYCGAGMSRSLVISAAAIARITDRSLTDCLAVVSADGPADVSPGLLAEVRAVVANIE